VSKQVHIGKIIVMYDSSHKELIFTDVIADETDESTSVSLGNFLASLGIDTMDCLDALVSYRTAPK